MQGGWEAEEGWWSSRKTVQFIEVAKFRRTGEYRKAEECRGTWSSGWWHIWRKHHSQRSKGEEVRQKTLTKAEEFDKGLGAVAARR